MRNWRPDQELERLLQALGQEILTVEEEELIRVLAETGHSKAGSLRQIASLVRAAAADYEEPSAEAPQAAPSGLGDHQARWPH